MDEREKEYQIKEMAGIIFDLTKKHQSLLEKNLRPTYDEQRSEYAEREWLNYQIAMAKTRLQDIKDL